MTAREPVTWAEHLEFGDPQRAIADMQAAWKQTFGGEGLPDTHAVVWLGRGLTVDLVPLLGEVVDRAVVRWGAERNVLGAALIGDQVRRAALDCLHADLQAPSVLAWLRALVAAPDADTAEAAWAPLVRRHNFEQAVARWQQWAALGDRLGPLGWSAGLQPSEVPGTPEADLAQMAALRGWCLPADGSGR